MNKGYERMTINFKFLYFSIFLIFVFSHNSFGATLKQRQFGESTGDVYYSDYGSSGDVPGTEGMSEMDVVSTLRQDIQLLDEEIMKCERKRKGWVAATVVGGVGVVGTGIGALVQNSKIQDKKSELQRVQSDVETTKQSVQDAEKRLQEMQ